MKILITGITGMTGSHLAEYLLGESKVEVHGTIRWRSNRENIADFEKKLHLHECELRDPHAVNRLIQKIRPQRIYHMAAQSNVAASWGSPHDTILNNVTAQLNLFEAVRYLNFSDVRIHVAGSSEEYGMVHKNELPVKETNPLRPLSPYAVSKVTQDTLAYQYFHSYGLHIVRTRAFNQIGPKQGEVFAASNFAKQIAQIEFNQREPVIKVGNVEVRRDFTDIRDVVRAYVMALEICEPGSVYNIGSGIACSIKKILDNLIGLSSLLIHVEKDPSRMRPSEVPALICDCSKFIDKTGWQPRISFKQSLFDLLDYWRSKLGRIQHFDDVEQLPAAVAG
ncbi:GDP-mannose 4,6-dehydratase [Thermodesulfobacteriota bacterium]